MSTAVRNPELRRANDPQGGVGFLRGGARPPTAALVRFIEGHKDRSGAGPICRVLTHYRQNPVLAEAGLSSKLSLRTLRGASRTRITGIR
jgi:hypothetical protein